MTTFWIICALLLLVAVSFVVVPLWKSAARDNQVLRDAANLEIFRDQIAEMDYDLRNGLLTQELYEQGRRELQARLLNEVKDAKTSAESATRNPHKKLALVMAALIPFLAVGLYLKVGNFAAFMPGAGTPAENFGTVHTAEALKELEDKVAKNPEDIQSLGTLAHSYDEQGRYLDAAKIYGKMTKITPNDAQLWTDFADSLAMASGQSLVGEPTTLLNRALSLDPNNPKALALSGSAALERGDFAATIQYWEKLLAELQPGSDDAKMISDGIAQAKAALEKQQKGGKPTPKAGAKSHVAAGHEQITGTLVLSASLKDKAGPNDMLFIVARAESGPAMPLAVMRGQVRDLPLKFSMDDSMAMSPQAKLSDFDKVILIARVAKSGDPMPHAGDLQGVSAPIKPGTHNVELSIDSVIK